MRISFLAAVAANGVIGRDNALPWHLSNDLKRLKTLTMGHHVIMGRKTFDEIGRKPLPGRPHVIISRSAFDPQENVVGVRSIDEAMASIPSSEDEVFILGGGEIFRQMMPRATRMYITQVHGEVSGDTYFNATVVFLRLCRQSSTRQEN